MNTSLIRVGQVWRRKRQGETEVAVIVSAVHAEQVYVEIVKLTDAQGRNVASKPKVILGRTLTRDYEHDSSFPVADTPNYPQGGA